MNRIYNNSDIKDKRPASNNEVRIEIPCIENNERNPLKKLKTKLFETIVKNRIYKEEDIQELFKHTRDANCHIDNTIVEDAISRIYNDINS